MTMANPRLQKTYKDFEKKVYIAEKQQVFLHLWSGFSMKILTLSRFLKAQRSLYDVCHGPRWPVRASTRSCFLAPVVGIPNCLQASFNTGTVSFARVPFCRWALSSSSETSTLGFFSAPPPPSAVIHGKRLKVKVTAHSYPTCRKGRLLCCHKLRFN